MLAAAEDQAAAIGVPVNIAVLDAGAHLKAFVRMDGAVLGSIDLAMRKAQDGRALRDAPARPSGSTASPARRRMASSSPMAASRPSPAAFRSRAADGETLGAVGVSGGAVPQDLEIAQAAVAAFKL